MSEDRDTLVHPLGWHCISGEHLLEVMRRCADGEDPDAVYAEIWANAEHERSDDDAGGRETTA